MIYNLRFDGGRVIEKSGDLPADLRHALWELTIEHPECCGKAVLANPQGDSPRVELRGEFSTTFEQKLRNLWGIRGVARSWPRV